MAKFAFVAFVTLSVVIVGWEAGIVVDEVSNPSRIENSHHAHAADCTCCFCFPCRR